SFALVARGQFSWLLDERDRLTVPRPCPTLRGMSDFVSAAALSESKQAVTRLREHMRRTIKGKDAVIEHTIVCLLARGHLLIEDLPGVGKTTLAYTLARALDCPFSRIQFTSDLLPSDVTGVAIYDESIREFVFKPGPV